MAVGPVRTLLLGTENADGTVTGVSADETTSQPIKREGYGILTIYLRSIGTTSGGNVTIEEADWGPAEHVYSGTWSVLATVAASSFTGGAQVVYHVTECAYSYVRVRISDAITGGGTIMAVMHAQGED